MQHVPENPFLKAARVAAFKGLHFGRGWTGLARVVIFFEEKQINL